jgi:hypothetical protein
MDLSAAPVPRDIYKRGERMVRCIHILSSLGLSVLGNAEVWILCSYIHTLVEMGVEACMGCQ